MDPRLHQSTTQSMAPPRSSTRAAAACAYHAFSDVPSRHRTRTPRIPNRRRWAPIARDVRCPALERGSSCRAGARRTARRARRDSTPRGGGPRARAARRSRRTAAHDTHPALLLRSGRSRFTIMPRKSTTCATERGRDARALTPADEQGAADARPSHLRVHVEESALLRMAGGRRLRGVRVHKAKRKQHARASQARDDASQHPHAPGSWHMAGVWSPAGGDIRRHEDGCLPS